MAEKEKLFTGFKSVSTKEWEEVIMNDLKGRDYNKSLIWNTYEGFKVFPYYREENIRGLAYTGSLPGEFPYVRGNNKCGNSWLIREDINVEATDTAKAKAIELLNKGVDSLGFIFQSAGMMTPENLAELLNDICLTGPEINFICPPHQSKYALIYRDYITRRNYDKASVYGSVSADPLGSMALSGSIDNSAMDELSDVIRDMSDMPGFRIITVHGTSYANSGATIVQELALALAQGTEYLIYFTDQGFKIDEIAGKIKFNFGISGSYFPEIAKLRAARLLWAKIVTAFGPEEENSAKLISHSVTNLINKTIYDPWVNILRTQTEAMSAALGGTGSITVKPYDVASGVTGEFSERIARNQQLLLKEESHLDKVADPGGGSYYIESLTASIVEAAWDIFLKIQEEGGFTESFKKGVIQAEIKQSAEKRKQKYAVRADNILGVTHYANTNEKISGNNIISLLSSDDKRVEGADFEPLKFFRYALPFEELRYKTDLYASENKRPVVFMLTVGDPVLRRARAQFSCNFFTVAGFEVIDNNGFNSVEDGVTAARERNADLIVLCSSDDEYPEAAPKAANLLKDEILVVAGNPACRPDLEKKGIKNFIHIKSNIAGELTRYQNLLIN
ncbi:MAG: methylmalonyl-CoA mutase family protein [Prolixibacteraceae bacterium]|nr:methylmalonyl-CoA mutase family protein [Prolixibacteraceae bacterium]